MAKSIAGEAIQTPSSPPIRNIATKPSANSMGGSKRSLPLRMVASQLKNSTPVGIEISSVVTEKNGSSTWPVTNMWCAQTLNDSAVISKNDSTTPVWPNSGLPENTGMISLTIPQAARISMYTSGWPKNQNTCCQSSTSPPRPGSKKVVPRRRSANSMISPAVSTGVASTTSSEVASVDQVKIGSLDMVMPGARSSRAITPATAKTANEFQKYRIPIFLWSVVVSHASNRVAGDGGGVSAGRWTSVIAMTPRYFTMSVPDMDGPWMVHSK